jgi:hypothetical protein
MKEWPAEAMIQSLIMRGSFDSEIKLTYIGANIRTQHVDIYD